VRGDGVQLDEVLQNLIDNALQYTPSGGRIDVTAYSNGHEVIFTVADRASGFRSPTWSAFFERFYRVTRPGHARRAEQDLALSIAAYRGCAWRAHLGGERGRQGSRFRFQHYVAS